MSLTPNLPISQFAGSVSEDLDYSDAPAKAVTFLHGERFVIAPGVTKQPPLPQRKLVKSPPTLFSYASYAGTPIVGEVSGQLKAWFPGKGLISMQFAQITSGLLAEDGTQLLSEDGLPLLPG